jgi:hypothetical protein
MTTYLAKPIYLSSLLFLATHQFIQLRISIEHSKCIGDTSPSSESSFPLSNVVSQTIVKSEAVSAPLPLYELTTLTSAYKLTSSLGLVVHGAVGTRLWRNVFLFGAFNMLSSQTVEVDND